MYSFTSAAVSLLALVVSCDAGAVITGILPTKGSLAGGTRIVVFGSGFGRDGKQGQTVVYVGNDICHAVEYDSGDDKITCYTPPAPSDIVQSASSSYPLDVRVAIVTIGEPSAYAACPRGNCRFTYMNGYTPYLDNTVLGGSAGDVANFGGLLYGDSTQQYHINVGAPTEKVYATCDVNDELNGRWADDVVTWNGYGVVKCYLGNREAGRYNVSLEVRDQLANGYGQGVRQRYAKMVAPSGQVHTFTQSPRITGLSYHAAGMNGGDDLVITGSGFSATPGNNVVTLPGGVACTVKSSSLTTITCTPSSNANGTETPAYNASAQVVYPGGAGLVHSVYRRNVWSYGGSSLDPRDPGFAGGPPADEVHLNLDALQGKYVSKYQQDEGTNYGQILSGFFVPKVSANYSFYCQADDLAEVVISPIPAQPGQTPPRPTLRMVRVEGYVDSWFAYTPLVRGLYLEAGQRYPIRVQHQEGSGWDWFRCGLRVHTEGNAAATAAYRSPLQETFKSLPSVQRITVTGQIVREVQRIVLTGATGGKFMLSAVVGGRTVFSTTELDSTATTTAVTNAVHSLATGCGSITTSRVALPKNEATNGTGFRWDVRFDCAVSNAQVGAGGWPMLSAVSTSLIRDTALRTGEPITLETSRIAFATPPIDGTLIFGLVHPDAGVTQSTTPVSVSDGGGAIRTALLSLPMLTGGDIEVARSGPGDARDGSSWTVTFWAPVGPKPTIAIDSSALLGPNATATVTVIEQGSLDPWYTPLPIVDWFETGYPRPTVSVVTNGILAGCDVHLWNESGVAALGGTTALPTPAVSAANPCGFEWSTEVTPTVTAISPTTVVTGDVITITGTGFLPASAGIGAAPDGTSLSVSTLNTVTMGDGSCRVTSVAPDGTSMNCTVQPTGAGVFTPTISMRMGRGVATLAVDVPQVTVEAMVSGFTPTSGSTAGGTLINITGSGFRTALSSNVVTVSSVPCVAVSIAVDGLSMVCRTGAAPAGTSDNLIVNGKDSGSAFTYSLASTPELLSLNRNILSRAQTAALLLTVSKATSAAVAASGQAFEVSVGDRSCTLMNVTYAGSSGATLACKLTRRPGPATLPQPLLMPLVYVPPFGYAAPPASTPESVLLDTGFRVTGIYPNTVSAHGGARLNITGRGFASTKDMTKIDFYHTGTGDPMDALHSVPCKVDGIAADGNSLTCFMGTPAVHHSNGWMDWGNSVVGTLNLTMNKVLAPCGASDETTYNSTACTLTFSNEATPVVSNLTFDGSTVPGTFSMSGRNFVAPFHVYFGTTEVDDVTVTNGGKTVTGTIPPQVMGTYAVQIHSDVLGYGHFERECHPGHFEPNNHVMYSYPLRVDPLDVTQVAEWGVSAAGGLVLAITGEGFSTRNERNIVRFWGVLPTGVPSSVTALIMDSTPTRLVVHTPAMSTTTISAGFLWTTINITVLHANLSAAMASVTVPAPAPVATDVNGTVVVTPSPVVDPRGTGLSWVRYNNSQTPQLTALAPSTGRKGTLLIITGTGFGSYSAGGGMPLMEMDDLGMGMGWMGMACNDPTESTVFIGGAKCTVAGPEDWSDRRINCTVGETPAGSHPVLVYRPGVGLARVKTGVSFLVNLTIIPGAAADTPNTGMGGGVPITINGEGFATLETGGNTTVSLCNTVCTVTGISYTQLNCTLGEINSPAAQQDLAVHEEHVIRGRGIASSTTSAANIANAFDGDVESSFTLVRDTTINACWVGLDLGAHSRATITRLRWYSQFTRTGALRAAVFEASNDASFWSTLGTVSSSSVQEGWSYIEVANTPTSPVTNWRTQPYYRYLRLRYDSYYPTISGGCVGMEVQFIGHMVAAAGLVDTSNPITYCPMNITVAGPTDAFIGPAAVTVGQHPLAVQYNTEFTPLILAISPNNGTALGGTTVTLTMTGISASNTPTDRNAIDLRLNGMPCPITNIVRDSFDTTIRYVTCITTPRTEIKPFSILMETGAVGGGTALVRPGLRWRYIDKWSQLNTWADDEPPLEGDTVIVPPGQSILVDVSPPPLFLVLVQGEMVFDRKDLTLDAHYILIHGGTFEVGTEREPFLNKLTITLHGDRFESVEIPDIGAKVLGVMNRGQQYHAHATADLEAIGIIRPDTQGHDGHGTMHSHAMGMEMGMGESEDEGGMNHGGGAMEELGMHHSDMGGTDGAPLGNVVQGVLEIHGRPRKRVWTKVATTIPAGSDVVTTAEDVDFEVGEVVVVTTSSYDPTEAEERTVIEVISARSFRVDRPFAYEHESRILPAGQWGHSDVDMRCEVGLLSRNIVIQGDEDKSDAQVFGVHTIAGHGGVYRIENAEIRRCGQQGQLGRYCTHQHMRGNAPGNYVRFNSIHHSYQRAATIHATNYATVKHNFAYHIVGHSIFVEDGVEKWNVIEENLVALTLPCYMCLKGDMKPASYWAASATNIWRHNVAAGCLGGGCNGYWHELPGNPHGPSFTTSICPVHGHLGEFYNNTARAAVKGLRVYPVYLPYNDPCGGASSGGFPVYYVNNTFIRNRDNGVFTKRGGDIHHVNAKVVETAGDDIHWTMLQVDYGWNPHIKNALVIGNLDPMNRPIWGKAGIQAPQDEFFYVSGATIVNFDSYVGSSTPATPTPLNGHGRLTPTRSIGPLVGCAMCNSDQFMKQGGYTSRWERLSWFNTSVRVTWTSPFKEIFYDLDGTLTGHVNGTTTPFYAWNDWPECPRDTVGTFDRGTVCDGSTRVRRIQVDNVTPRELPDYSINMNISQWAIHGPGGVVGVDDRAQHANPLVPYHQWSRNTEKSGIQQFRVKDTYGWVFTMVTGRRYAVGWNTKMDWRTVRLRYSEPEYITDLSGPGFPAGTGEWTGVSFSWIDERYRNRVLYTPASSATGVDMPTAEIDTAIPRFDAPFGSSALPNGNKTWHTILNARYVVNGTDLSVGSQFSRQNVNTLNIANIQCPPLGCTVPDAPTPLGNVTLWSDVRTWPGGRLPVEGEDVLISSNMSVALDINPPRLRRLTIEGRLAFQAPALGVSTPRRLVADAIVVWGELLVGTVESPYNHSAGAEIVLNGQRDSQAVILDNSLFLGNKVMVVLGRVSLVGRQVVRTWTRLNVTAEAGSTTLRLNEPVNGATGNNPGPLAWQVGDRIVISPTEYEPTELETATITDVSPDGRTLTLSAPLQHRHFAGFASPTGPTAGVRLSAAVGLLSRSVVVRGNVTAPTDLFHSSYGGHMYIGAVNRWSVIDGRRILRRREGSLEARWVQFDSFGKGSMEHGALNFQYGSYDLDPALDQAGQSSVGSRVGTNPPSTVQGCAFSNMNNYGLVSFEASHLTLDRNMWHNGKRTTLDLDGRSLNATITGNLIVGSFRSPDTGNADQFQWVIPQAAMQLLALPRMLRDNYVAGSIDIGYSLRPVDCASALSVGRSAEVYSGNEAVSTVVGVFILPTATPSGCGRVNGFTVWKAAHIGIVAVDGLTDLTVSNAVLSDNHIGLSLNFVVGKRGQARSDLVDSMVIGSSAASINRCSASTVCRAYTKADTLGATCGSVLGSGYRRVGILAPQYTNRGKTCAVDGGLDVCRPPNRPERLCSMPWENRYGLPSTRHTHAYITNVVFSNFAGEGGDCGRHSRAIMTNPTQPDMSVPFSMTSVTWSNVTESARFYFAMANGALADDDAHSFALITDVDGSVTGTAGTSIIGSSPTAGLPSPACRWMQGWHGQLCPGVIFRQAIFESLDRDRGFRKLGQLQITRPAGDGSSNVSDLVLGMNVVNRTSMSLGPEDDMCAMRFYFAQYPFLVRPGTVNHLLVPSTHPQVSRIHLFSPDASESLVLRMFVQRPNSQEVWVDGVQVLEKNAVSATDFPKLADPAGTFLFDPQDKHITLTLRGGYSTGTAGGGNGAVGSWGGGMSATYDIVRLSSIQLNFKLAVDINTFYGENLVSNLATLLNIDPSRIKIVSVHAGSTNVAMEILPPANSTAALLAAASNASDTAPVVQEGSLDGAPRGSNSTSNATSDGGAGSGEEMGGDDGGLAAATVLLDTHTLMTQIVEKVATLASSGALASVGGYAVQSLSVVPPPAPVLSPTDNTTLANATNGGSTGGITGPITIVPAQPSDGSKKALDSTVVAGAVVGAVVGLLVVGAAVYWHVRSSSAVRALTNPGKLTSVAVEGSFAGSNPHFQKPHAKVPFPPATVPPGGLVGADGRALAPARVPSISNLFPSLFNQNGNFQGRNPMGMGSNSSLGSSTSPRASTRLGYTPQTAGHHGGQHRAVAAGGGANSGGRVVWSGPSLHNVKDAEGVHTGSGAAFSGAMSSALHADAQARAHVGGGAHGHLGTHGVKGAGGNDMHLEFTRRQ